MDRQYCTFRLDRHWFGIPVQQVQEVLSSQRIARVPLAPDEVQGLINLRGQIVMVIDLRKRLNLAPRQPGQNVHHVIVQSYDEFVGFSVDQMCDVRQVDSTPFEPPPDTLSAAHRELISGSYQQPEGLLLVLNVEKTANVRVKSQDA